MSDPFMPADDRYGNEIIERLQARLTAAETRIKELEKERQIVNCKTIYDPHSGHTNYVCQREQLTESSRLLREGLEAVEMENKRLSKENDGLREELEAVRSANDVLTEHSVAAMDIADGDVKPSDFAKVENQCPMLSSVVKLKRKSIADTTALAVAKEALEYAQHRARCEYALTTDEIPTIKTNYDNALALIAECEKETA
jgi:cell division septum initiation protein DivIVA